MNWKPWLASAAVFLIPLLVGLRVDRQGLDLIEDGRWLMSAEHFGELHRSIESSEAPARAILLRACSIGGVSAYRLSVLQALLSGLLALALYAAATRSGAGRLRWLAPILVLALGPPTPEIVWLGLALWASLRGSRAIAMVALLAPFFGPTVWLAALLLCLHRAGWRPSAAVAAGGLLLLGLHGLLLGAPGAILWQVVALPFTRGLEQLREGSALAWLHSLRGGPFLRTPYAGLDTGESPGVELPGHATLKLGASVLLYLLALGATPWLAFRSWRERSALPWCVVACSGLWLLLLRGDLPQLQLSLLSGAALAPFVASAGATRRALAIVLCAALLVPLFERTVLAIAYGRDSLVLWEEPQLEVLVSEQRMRRLNALAHELTHDEGPLFVWPPAVGLNLLTHRPLATRALLPRAGDDRLYHELENSKPTTVLLAPSVFLGWDGLAHREPRLMERLRGKYRLLGSISGGLDEYRALELLGDDEDVLQLTLPQRLPVAEMTVGNDVSPLLRKGFTVGQGVRMGSRDLNGLSLRWASSITEIQLDIRVRIWMKRGDAYDTLLDYFDTDVFVPRDGHRSYLRFGPIEGTAGLDLGLTVEVREISEGEVRLYMHRHDGPGRRSDFYPVGSALFDEKPVDADLVFAIY